MNAGIYWYQATVVDWLSPNNSHNRKHGVQPGRDLGTAGGETWMKGETPVQKRWDRDAVVSAAPGSISWSPPLCLRSLRCI